MNDTNIVVVTGPSGAGKTSIVKALLQRNTRLKRVVTHTSRPPREGEIDGVDYHFVPEQEIIDLARMGRMAEYAKVYGTLYGTSLQAIDTASAGGSFLPLLTTDAQGAAVWRDMSPEHAAVVLVMPPSEEELLRRLGSRGTEDSGQIFDRLAHVYNEVVLCTPIAGYIALNDDFEQAVSNINNFINTRYR